MDNPDIRWIQRFNNFLKALSQLLAARDLSLQRPLSKLEEQGLIQSFEYTHELAWNTMKDFLGSHGAGPFYGSKDTTREAFKRNIVENGEVWMDMILSRNLSSHTYDEDTAARIVSLILGPYVLEFDLFREKMNSLIAEETQ